MQLRVLQCPSLRQPHRVLLGILPQLTAHNLSRIQACLVAEQQTEHQHVGNFLGQSSSTAGGPQKRFNLNQGSSPALPKSCQHDPEHAVTGGICTRWKTVPLHGAPDKGRYHS
jgi:hypothetical protein